MKLKSALPLAAIALLAFSPLAHAQPAGGARPTYSDAQMSAFARATVELQALGSQDPAAMTRTIERSGLQVQDYNAMGDAMRADPGLAASLNPYLDEANAEHRARLARIPDDARTRSVSQPHRASTHSTHTRHAKATSHRRGGHAVRHASKSGKSRHAKASKHAKASGRHVASHAHAKKTRASKSSAHATTRHRHRKS